MKGIILAGGLGSRLLPMTRITNKHLLPVYDRPMIYYPLECLIKAGITEIMIVTGGNHAGDFLRLLKDGREFGLKQLNYTYQDGEGGIAEALGLCEHFADGEPVCVVLGDNILERDIAGPIGRYREDPTGGKVLLKEVNDPERFGVAHVEDGRVVRVVEKPKNPQSRLAVTGVYMYDARVFDIIKTLEPSNRGELEITDVNNCYADWGELKYEMLEGWWTDAGTVQSLYRACQLVAENGANRSPESDGESVSEQVA